jgi:virginiamycin B lyase
MLTLGALLANSAPAERPVRASQPHFLREYTLPLGAYPGPIVTGSDGALWFSTFPYFTNHPAKDLGIGRITVAGFIRFFLIGLGTYDLTLGHDGKIWFTNAYQHPYTVGSLTTTGTVQQYSVPSAGTPESIATDAAGDLWYSAFGTNPDIVRINTSGQTVAVYHTHNASVVRVAPGPRASIWFDELGRRSMFGRITQNGGFTERFIGGPAYIPGPLVLGPDGRMWISDCSYAAAIRPSTFDVEFYPIPANGCIEGIIAGPDGNLWAADFDLNAIARITPRGVVTEYTTPTPEMMPTFLTVGPDGNIWYTEIQRNTDVSKIGVLAP